MDTANPASAVTTVEDAARRLGIGRTLAYQAARDGELPGVIRIGRKYVVSVAALDRVLAHGDAKQTAA